MTSRRCSHACLIRLHAHASSGHMHAHCVQRISGSTSRLAVNADATHDATCNAWLFSIIEVPRDGQCVLCAQGFNVAPALVRPQMISLKPGVVSEVSHGFWRNSLVILWMVGVVWSIGSSVRSWPLYRLWHLWFDPSHRGNLVGELPSFQVFALYRSCARSHILIFQRYCLEAPERTNVLLNSQS